mmetsp:Transcript_20503/g.56885  ORF Transcript_20503/g.56885 Transcript_20503/m.56885 type:complete len:361 (+) Transcript_20503:2615-3697(+)
MASARSRTLRRRTRSLVRSLRSSFSFLMASNFCLCALIFNPNMERMQMFNRNIMRLRLKQHSARICPKQENTTHSSIIFSCLSTAARWYMGSFPAFTRRRNSIAHCALTSSSPRSAISVRCIRGVRTLVEYPISMAVSRLSPVNTQSLIPALPSVAMVSGTPTCSLSSMAVAPTMCRSLSSASAASVSFSSRPLMAVAAAVNCSSHSSHCASVRKRTPRTSVRRPSDANSPRCDSSPRIRADSHSELSVIAALFSSRAASGPKLEQISGSTIAESAPLQRRIAQLPYCGGDRRRMDIRFRVESNLLMARTDHVSMSSSLAEAAVRWNERFPLALSEATVAGSITPLFSPFTSASSENRDG